MPMGMRRARVLRLCTRSARAASPWSSWPGARHWVVYRGSRWMRRRGTAMRYSGTVSGGGVGGGSGESGVGVGVGMGSRRRIATGARVGLGGGVASVHAMPTASRMVVSAATGRAQGMFYGPMGIYPTSRFFGWTKIPSRTPAGPKKQQICQKNKKEIARRNRTNDHQTATTDNHGQ